MTKHGSDQSIVFLENYARGPGGHVGPLVRSRGNAPVGVWRQSPLKLLPFL